MKLIIKSKKCLLTFLFTVMILYFFPLTVFSANTANSADVYSADEFKIVVNDKSISQINVNKSIDLTGANVLDVSGKVINLNGNTISSDNFTLIFEGSDFTIKNGTFSSNNRGSYALFIGENETNNVVIEDITAIGGVNVFNSTNVILRNVNAVGPNYYVIWCDEGGQVSVENGSFESTSGPAVVGLTKNGSVLEIKGGTFISTGKPLVLKNGDNYGIPSISGGTFSDKVDIDYLASGNSQIKYTNKNTSMYYIGNNNKINDIVKDAKEGDKIEVVSGDLDLDIKNSGVFVVNQGDGNVLVNNKKLNKDTEIITEIKKDDNNKDNNDKNENKGTPVKDNNNPYEKGNDKTNSKIEKITNSPDTSDNGNLILFASSTLISLFSLGIIINKKFI